jgi:rhamnose utilization protein RhaD (predicted bifunctional aldolase and dehydrogenase)
MDLLETITRLSHEFGAPEYVKGGGGNSSVKSDDTLWVKPSGMTLAGMAPERFVAMDRAKIALLHSTRPPVDVNERERLVVRMMAEAVRPDSAGRPSVEAPLHDTFSMLYVVHTHAELVNGLTCAREGAAASARLFPDALWIEYVDPGWTLCAVVRERIAEYVARRGCEPTVVILDNHGVFVQGETAEAIRRTYAAVLGRLREEYAKAGVSLTVPVGAPPSAERVEQVRVALADALGAEAASVVPSGPFAVPSGPISPDHIVYAKSYSFIGEPDGDALAAFRARHGYAPRIVVTVDGVFGVGASEKVAVLALELARDGALLEQLAPAFGGIEYLDDREREFIENWEAEAYRQQQV